MAPHSSRNLSDGGRVVVLADVGAVDQHDPAVANIAGFIAEWRPDEVRILTDIAACTVHADVPGRSRGGWFDFSKLVSGLRLLRAGFDGVISLRAPAVAAATFGRDRGPCCAPAAELKSLRVRCGPVRYAASRSWSHGYLRPQGVPAYPGRAAIHLAQFLTRSVVAAGTGLVGLICHSTVSGSAQRRLWGMEIGTLRAPTRQRRHTMLGFGIVDAGTPYPLTIDRDGSFTAMGTRYG